MKCKFLITSIFVFLIFSLSLTCLGHSGRTDSNGGHKDNKNVSGLGSYHYHCGGYPAHLHSNGVCPYKTNTQTYTVPEVVTTVKAEKVEIQNGESRTLNIGQTLTLSATVSPSNATDKSISWSSDNENVVKIDSNGKVEAVSNGTATITVKTSNGMSDYVKVTVQNKPAKISIYKAKDNIEIGEEYQFKYIITPSDAETSCTWSSSDKTVVTVSTDGTIKGIKAGSATVTVKTDNNISASITVTVNPKKINTKDTGTNNDDLDTSEDSQVNVFAPLLFLGGCAVAGGYIIYDRRKK